MDDKTYLKMDYRAQPGPEYYKSRKDTPLEDRHTIHRFDRQFLFAVSDQELL